MEVTIKRQRVVTETLEVDDRVHDEGCHAFKVANIILDGFLSRIIDRDLYSDSELAVESAVSRINDAFRKADSIINL